MDQKLKYRITNYKTFSQKPSAKTSEHWIWQGFPENGTKNQGNRKKAQMN